MRNFDDVETQYLENDSAIQSQIESAPSEATNDGKISTGEKVLLTLISLSGDIAEILGFFSMAIPIIGQVIFFLAVVYGFFTSAILNIWGFFRGVPQNKKNLLSKRIILLLGGGIGDTLTSGFLPIRTTTLWISIYLQNK